MKFIVNWGAITKIFAGLFVADLLAGFIAADLVVCLAISFALSLLVFALVAFRQNARPFLHAGLALLLYFGFSQILGSVLPTWLSNTSIPLAALNWLPSFLALVIGTSVGRFASTTRRADA